MMARYKSGIFELQSVKITA